MRWSRQFPQEEGIRIVKTQEVSVVSRRMSQLSSHLFRRLSQKTGKKQETLDEMSLECGKVAPQSSRGSSAEDVASRDSALMGDEVVLVPPPAVTRMSENR